MSKLNRFIIYLLIVTGIIGYSLPSISLGLFYVYPFRGLLLLYLAVSIVTFLHKGTIPYAKNNIFVINILFSWIVYALIQLLWVHDPRAAIGSLSYLVSGALMIYFSSINLKKRNQVDFACKVWIATALFFVVIAMAEIYFGFHLPRSKYFTVLVGEGRRFIPTSFFVNPNNLAVFIFLSFFLTLALVRAKKSILESTIGYIFLFFQLFVLIKTGSRLVMLAFVLSIFTYIIVHMFLDKKFLVKRFAQALAMLLVVAIGSIVLNFHSIIENEISEIADQLEYGYGSASVRVNITRRGFDMFVDSYMLGIGGGNTELYLEVPGKHDTHGIVNMHNFWMELLVEYGFFVFGLFVFLYLNLMRMLFLKCRGNDELATALFSIFIGLPVALMSPSSSLGFHPLWIFLAVVVPFLALPIETGLRHRGEEHLFSSIS